MILPSAKSNRTNGIAKSNLTDGLNCMVDFVTLRIPFASFNIATPLFNVAMSFIEFRADPSSSTKWYELKVGPFKINKAVLESLRNKKLRIIPVLRIPSNGPYVNIYHCLCRNIITIYLGVFHGLSGW
ncbi:hypothetical protein IEQ34_010483 [Dendrobium chrysotoxum]|uniref:SPOR domain-containing protein n=1 Tax=Dendrobium chrysotoxum TaxID=161865 RepID=A0AAV7GUR4_DENCH|nr:hypothetical protein IEQ34_010483 [Dendrobium chrysotoxum]